MKRFVSHLARGLSAVAVFSLIGTSASAAPPYQNTDTATISQKATPCKKPLVRTIVVDLATTIVDLDVGILIPHAWREDVRITLQSPAGTTVQLVDDFGGGGSGRDNYNILLDDEADDFVNTGSHAGADLLTPLYDNPVRPNNPLSAFDGQNAQGTWTLRFCDVFSADNGSFTSAELFITDAGAPVPPPLGCPAGEQIRHDWATMIWPARSLINTYTTGGEDLRLTVGGSTASLTPDPETGAATPVVSSYYTGGFGTSETGLFIHADYPDTNSGITVTLEVGDLGAAQNPGVGELQFTIFDLDLGDGQFQDRAAITGSDGVNTILPMLTTGSANSASGNVVTGNSPADPDSGTGSVVVTFTERVNTVTISHGSGPLAPTNPGHQSITVHDIITCPSSVAILQAEKTNVVETDGYALPGNDMIYTIAVTNAGTGPADTDSILLVDAMPPEVAFFMGSGASPPITFTETGTGLSFDYATDAGFWNGPIRPTSFAGCSYTPNAGYDPAVSFICLNPKGAMAAGSPFPSFSFEFRARIE